MLDDVRRERRRVPTEVDRPCEDDRREARRRRRGRLGDVRDHARNVVAAELHGDAAGDPRSVTLSGGEDDEDGQDAHPRADRNR